MRISRPVGLWLLSAAALGSVVALITGCGQGNRPQLDVPPPPLMAPRGEFRDQLLEPVLVPSEADPAPLVDMRLASGSGLGRPLYESVEPILRRRTAQLLAQAQDLALQRGYVILLLDAGRTPQAHSALVAMAGDPEFVPPADPEFGCPDIRGAAIDVTLLDSRNGDMELAMGTRYMEIAPASGRRFAELDKDHLSNRAILAKIMDDAGFDEGHAWWDYHDPEWVDTPDLTEEDVPHTLSSEALEALESPATAESPESAPAAAEE